MIVARESRDFSAAMLGNPHKQIIGYTDVQNRARLVAHHVNEVLMIFRQFVRSFDCAPLRSG